MNVNVDIDDLDGLKSFFSMMSKGKLRLVEDSIKPIMICGNSALCRLSVMDNLGNTYARFTFKYHIDFDDYMKDVNNSTNSYVTTLEKEITNTIISEISKYMTSSKTNLDNQFISFNDAIKITNTFSNIKDI